jgi:predicted metalloprotease
MAFWDRIASRGDVEDRRGLGPAGIGGGLGLGGLALILALTYFTGGDLGDVISQIDPNTIVQEQPQDTSQFEGQDPYEVFSSTVLGSNNVFWTNTLNQNNQDYIPPKLVLFRQATESGCGTATSSVGPHYCPLDQTIYLDETFFDELTSRLGAEGGDVAEAYVMGHEVGHHIQNQLGTIDQGRQSNEDSINVELQADCFAGMWLGSLKNQNIFEQNEIREAMDAAASVGDDRIQEKVTGQINPESWTHGSSAQRMEWFNRGYNTDQLSECNTST